MQLIRAAGLPTSLWPNGAGRKADLLAGDGWSISFAWLEADAPFSDLPGIDRTFTLVEGPGCTLVIDGSDRVVRDRFVPERFDGGASTQCRIAGPSRVLNVMTERARIVHRVTILEASGEVDPAGNLACVLVALDGPVHVGELVLERLDAARIEHPAALRLSPGCRAACIMMGHAG